MYSIQEKQHAKTWWVWALLSGLWILFLILLIQNLMLPESEKDPDMDLWVSLGFLSIPTLLIIFFLRLKLIINANDQGILIHLTPLMAATLIPWQEIQSIEPVRLKNVGYGYRISLKLGAIYRLEGDEGVQITCRNGAKISFSLTNDPKIHLEKLRLYLKR